VGPDGRRYLRGWLLHEAARLHASVRSWAAADRDYTNAAATLKPVSALAAAQLARDWAETFRQRGDPVQASKHFNAAVQQRRALSPDTLALAAVLLAAGEGAYR
jgi:hypothetical protein